MLSAGLFDSELSFIILLLVYATIIYEIVVLPVPSVASTYQLFYVDRVEDAVKTSPQGSLLQRVRQLSTPSKCILLFIPTAISVINYCFPLCLYFLPETLLQTVMLLSIKSFWGDILGLVLIVLGRSLALSSVVKIRAQNSQKNDDFELKTGGLFGFSRNPILLGMYLTYWGIFFILPNIVSLIGFFIYAANMHFRILLEEDFLTHLFGEKFIRYRDNTRRYI